MPGFTIEKSSKIVYGPFMAPSENHLVKQLLAGELNMEEMAGEDLVCTTFRIKRMKDPVQGNLPGLKVADDQGQ